MSSSVQSEVSSQGPFSPKKKYHQTEGKGSLEESVHNVKHLDLNMARSNHSVDLSILDNNSIDGSSDDEIVEVDETTGTGWDESENNTTECKRNTNDVIVVATTYNNTHNNDNNDNDDSSYEEEIIEEEIYDLDDDDDDDDDDEEMVDATKPTTPTVVRDEIHVPHIQRMTLEEEIAQHESATNITSASSTSPVQPISPYYHQQSTTDNNDTENKNLAWEKPEWTKSPVLKNTAKGQYMKAGGTVSAPITNIAEHVIVIAEKKDLSFQKPDWIKNTKLRSTGKADVLKSEGTLAKPITNLPHLNKDFDKDELTMLEKSNISTVPMSSPTTLKVNNTVDENDNDDDKKIGWEKPEWATKKVLKGTQKGDKLKAGGTLSRPIGGIKPIDD